jgi:hypothetical protein
MNWVEAAGYLASAYRCHRQQYCFHHLWVLRQRTPCPGAARDLAAAECLARYSDASLDKAGGLPAPDMAADISGTTR